MKPIKALPLTLLHKATNTTLLVYHTHYRPLKSFLIKHMVFFSYYISIFLPIQARRRESKNQNTGGVILKKREHMVLKLSSVPLSEVDCLD